MSVYEGVFKSSQAGHLERELQMVQLSATGCSCVTILWASLVSFATIILCVAFHQVFIFVYLIIDSVWKLLNTPSYDTFHILKSPLVKLCKNIQVSICKFSRPS